MIRIQLIIGKIENFSNKTKIIHERVEIAARVRLFLPGRQLYFRSQKHQNNSKTFFPFIFFLASSCCSGKNLLRILFDRLDLSHEDSFLQHLLLSSVYLSIRSCSIMRFVLFSLDFSWILLNASLWQHFHGSSWNF